MIRKSDVCVLIPAYNEEKNIAYVVSAVRANGYSALVVDDGSTDGSQAVISSLDAAHIFSPINEGKGATLRRGLQWFLTKSFQAVILMDGDGQHAANELDVFLKALNDGADVAVGNRLWKPQGMPFVRLATNRIMSWILSGVAGQRIMDTQCGYRAFTRRVIESLKMETDRFETESEMLLDSASQGFKIVSVPVSSLYQNEVSHIRPARDTMRFFKFLFKYVIKRDRIKRQLNQPR